MVWHKNALTSPSEVLEPKSLDIRTQIMGFISNRNKYITYYHEKYVHIFFEGNLDAADKFSSNYIWWTT